MADSRRGNDNCADLTGWRNQAYRVWTVYY
jgi:hypothetical protein